MKLKYKVIKWLARSHRGVSSTRSCIRYFESPNFTLIFCHPGKCNCLPSPAELENFAFAHFFFFQFKCLNQTQQVNFTFSCYCNHPELFSQDPKAEEEIKSKTKLKEVLAYFHSNVRKSPPRNPVNIQLNKISHVPNCVQFCRDQHWRLDHANLLPYYFTYCSPKEYHTAELTCFSKLPLPFNYKKCHPGNSLALVATLAQLGKQSCNWPAVISLQRLGAKKGLGNQEWAWFCPKVPGLREKEKSPAEYKSRWTM